MAHVGVSLGSDEKERWRSYVEESSYGNISEFVRAAVRKEMRGQTGDESATIPNELQRRIDELASAQKAVKGEVSALSDEFKDVRDEVDEQEYSDQTIDLAYEITDDIDTIYRSDLNARREDLNEQQAQLAEEHLGDRDDRARIERALEYLRDNLDQYVRLDDGYYRVEGASRERTGVSHEQ